LRTDGDDDDDDENGWILVWFCARSEEKKLVPFGFVFWKKKKSGKCWYRYEEEEE